MSMLMSTSGPMIRESLLTWAAAGGCNAFHRVHTWRILTRSRSGNLTKTISRQRSGSRLMWTIVEQMGKVWLWQQRNDNFGDRKIEAFTVKAAFWEWTNAHVLKLSTAQRRWSTVATSLRNGAVALTIGDNYCHLLTVLHKYFLADICIDSMIDHWSSLILNFNKWKFNSIVTFSVMMSLNSLYVSSRCFRHRLECDRLVSEP